MARQTKKESLESAIGTGGWRVAVETFPDSLVIECLDRRGKGCEMIITAGALGIQVDFATWDAEDPMHAETETGMITFGARGVEVEGGNPGPRMVIGRSMTWIESVPFRRGLGRLSMDGATSRLSPPGM